VLFGGPLFFEETASGAAHINMKNSKNPVFPPLFSCKAMSTFGKNKMEHAFFTIVKSGRSSGQFSQPMEKT
jgi:hypothetical protein